MRRPLSDSEVIGAGLGILVAMSVAGLLGSVRGEVSQANAGLVLVLVIVAAASIGGRWAGGATALVAAVSFDFFLTKPCGSLAIKSGGDVLTTGLLFVVGVAVGQIARSQWHAKEANKAVTEDVAGLNRIAQLSANGSSLHEVIDAVEAEVTQVLQVPACHFTLLPADPPRPELEPTGRVKTSYVHQGQGFALPPEGITIAVRSAGRVLGWLVCDPPRALVGISRDRRRTALVLASLLGLALGQADRGADAV